MKSLKSYLLIVVLALSAVFVPSILSAKTKPVRNRSNICNNKVVECISYSPKTTSISPATADKNGFIVLKVDKPGTYKTSAADGPKKDQVIETITATKAGTVSLSVKLAVAAKE
jgi:hypothetical protein